MTHDMDKLKPAPARALPAGLEPAFHGFLDADECRVNLCFTPSAPRHDGTYATAYYTADQVLAPGPAARQPVEPQRPKGMTNINSRLSFNHGWVACERHHGIRTGKTEVADEGKTAAAAQVLPRLAVRVVSYPESNGKRNWTALLTREAKWGGLIGNSGGVTLARGELWNRVAYEAERARFLLGQRDTEPFILDYGDDIQTPEEWKGEEKAAARAAAQKGGAQ